jgi:uncharacterized protein YbcV (DUF1398 family)
MFPINELENILKQAKENQWPYPKTFAALKMAGVISYEITLGNCGGTYYGMFGVWKEPPPKDCQPLAIVELFSQEAAKEALARHQQSQTNYTEWLVEMAAAGVSHYRVNIEERTVTYYDKGELNSLVEGVPL